MAAKAHPKMRLAQFPPELPSLMSGLVEVLADYETSIPKPTHKDLVEEWTDLAKAHVRDIYPEDPGQTIAEELTTGLLQIFDQWSAAGHASHKAHSAPIAHEAIHALMNRPQTTQRSESWYEQFKNQLTASEFSKISASPRERGTLVLQKAGKIDLSGRSSHVPTYRDSMVAFDWGICLEPVVKQILEHDWDAQIQDVGRFDHPTDSRLAASPDGVLLQCGKYPEKAGHLVEIKCPKSRKIGVKLPLEYFYQMQLQMEVTGVRACEYVEMKFDLISEVAAAAEPEKVAAAKLAGKAILVGLFSEEKQEWLPSKYVYGPVGDLAWKPELGLNEQTLEISVWLCHGWHHETVLRDEAWFASLMPKIDSFWEDVAKAKAGEFVLPESTRKRKEKVVECLLKDDSDGEALPTAAAGGLENPISE
jgi:hypothetical protein